MGWPSSQDGQKGALHKRQAVGPPSQEKPFPPERGRCLWLHTQSCFNLLSLSPALPRCSTRSADTPAKGN